MRLESSAVWTPSAIRNPQRPASVSRTTAKPAAACSARAPLASPPLVLDARAGELGFARGSGDARRVQAVLRPLEGVEGRRTIAVHSVGLDAHVIELDVEFRQRLGHPVARHGRVLEGMT